MDGPNQTPAPAAECSTSDIVVQDPLYLKIRAKKAKLCHLVEGLYKEAMVGIGLIEVMECKIENLPELVKGVIDKYAPGVDNKGLKEMHRYYASLLTKLKNKERRLGYEIRGDMYNNIREDFMTVKHKLSKSAKRERARRRKRQTLRPNGNQQRQNDKMRCPGHPHLEGRVEEIGMEALTLPTSRQLMAVGHDYYKKVPMKMNISHGGVFICLLGVLLLCDPAAYVRPMAHASYLFRAGGVNSNSIRVFNPAAEMLS
ncbi:hypothetical protein AgCh_000346 [Apium graveolens]